MTRSVITWNRSARRKRTPWRGAPGNTKSIKRAPDMTPAEFRKSYDYDESFPLADTSGWGELASKAMVDASALASGAPLDASHEAMFLLYPYRECKNWGAFGEHLCAAQGVAFALEVLAQVNPLRASMNEAAPERTPRWFVHDRAAQVMRALRRQLAVVKQEEYDAAVARAEELWEAREEDLAMRLQLAYLFPDHTEWGDAVALAWPARHSDQADAIQDYASVTGLVYGAGASKERLLELNAKLFTHDERFPPRYLYMTMNGQAWGTMFDLVDRLGEDALEILIGLYENTWHEHPTELAEAMALIGRAEIAQAFANAYAQWINHESRPNRWEVDTRFLHDHPEMSLAPLEAARAATKRGKNKFDALLKDIKAQVAGATREKEKASTYIDRDTLPPALAQPIWRDPSRKRERKKYDPSAFADLKPLPASSPRRSATRAEALRWTRRFPEAAAAGAIPRLLEAEDSKERGGFVEALRVAHTQDAEAVERVIEAYGEQVAAALPTLDPYQFIPTRMPRLPHFWTPELWTPIRLKSDPSKLLPHEIHEDIGFMFKFSPPGTPYIGLVELGEVADETSLADFAWDIFTSWLEAGAPSNESWAIQGIALFGGAKMADLLPHYINQWCRRGKTRRAEKIMFALENGDNPYIVEVFWRLIRTPSLAVPDGAQAHAQKVTGIPRGIDAIADAKAPTFGLGSSRQLELEPGSDLEVWLDADLEPHLRTSNQAKAKLTPTARLRWKRLGTQCARENRFQAMRFERAMKTRRKWPLAEWRDSVLPQPLLGLLAQRIVWGSYDGQHKLVETWRVDESNELVDVQDEPYAPPAESKVGIVHPLEMSEEDLREWTLVLGDYEIIQPFAQITRRLDEATLESIEALFDELKRREFTLGAIHRLCEVGGWVIQHGDSLRKSPNTLYRVASGAKHASPLAAYVYFLDGFNVEKPAHLVMRSKTRIYRGGIDAHNDPDAWERLSEFDRVELHHDLTELLARSRPI